MRIKFNHGMIKMLVLLAALLLAVAGCSSSGGGTEGTTPVTPTGTTPAAMSLSANPGTIAAGATSTISAVVTDEVGAIVVGQTVTFSVESLYGTITATADTNASGVATATFTSSGQTGTATITGAVGSSVTDATTVIITPVAAYISLSTSKTSILTDGVDAATITATVLDASRVPIEGIAVNFSVAAGQLSAANVVTGVGGQAATSFTSGSYEKTNQVATVTATVQALIATIPIRITGTTITLAIGVTELSVAGSTSLDITVEDGGGQPIFGADVTIAQSSSNGGLVTLSAASGTTDVTGLLSVTVTGQSAGTVTLTVSALGVTKTQVVTVSGTPFEITSPTASSVSRETGTTLAVTVRSPLNHNVKFVTSMGTWVGDVTVPFNEMTVTAPAGSATATLNVGSNAGIATVRVEDATNSAINDTLLVAVYAPADEAAKLSMQVSPSVIAPSGGGVTNNATIEATVRNATNEVVGDAPVTFTLFRTTGGGEYVSPPIVYTGSDGEATTSFYSGSLVSDTTGVMCLGRIDGSAVAGPASVFAFVDNDPAPDTITRSSGDFTADLFVAGDRIRVSGSDNNDGEYTIDAVAALTLTLAAADVLINEAADDATMVIATAQDTDVVSIKIGGQGSSISIGGATVVEVSDTSPTIYRYPMSVIVNDSNGNPVPGVVVTLSVFPIKYATGWTGDEGPVRTGEFWNEDLNRNDFLDTGEDTYGPFPPRPAAPPSAGTVYIYDFGEGPEETSGNGRIDPAKSCAGIVPATVTTDADGVAQFEHVYQKNYAGWIKVEYRATAFVYTTETVSTMSLWLSWSEDEAANIPPSPWGIYPWSWYPTP